MRSDPTLKKIFREYNRMFFGNKLPHDTQVRWRTRADVKREGLTRSELAVCLSFNSKPPFEILLNPVVRRLKWGGVIRSTILHEMVHVKTKNRDNHGPAFEREMRRLANMGAFSKGRGRKSAPLW